ncbi:MAG: extracellular solute-binding protein [Azoarcus sp.]|jgi:ABC-type Fe3+ transport system substrate-binding protein|nr:extracellular solute-binding protein [Azoarcus sp.]
MTDPIDRPRRRLVGTLLLAGAAGSLVPGCALFAAKKSAMAERRVVVLTSYAEELVQRFQQAFEQKYPDARVEVLWRHSADALAYLRRGGMAEIDVYWTPAPRNFALLKQEGRFARLTLDRAALPPAIGGTAISDPDGYYAAFELAGYGIAYNPEAVRKLGLPPPRDWGDLADPAYRGKVQMPIPGRVGFAPVMAEIVLQGEGWDKAWATFSAIAANVDFGSGDRSPDTDEVAAGHKAARMSIDFFITPSRRNADPAAGELAFVYPPKTAFNPSHVGISAQAPHPEMAKAFVDFVLSAPAQEMLLEPAVRRLPVRRDVYAAHPELTVRPFDGDGLAYDDELRRDRQGLVAALFDIAIVQPHVEALALWNDLDRADREGRGSAARRAEIRALLGTVPVSDEAQRDEKLRRLFAFPDREPGKPELPPSPERLAIEARWKAEVKDRLAAARRLLQALQSKSTL